MSTRVQVWPALAVVYISKPVAGPGSSSPTATPSVGEKKRTSVGKLAALPNTVGPLCTVQLWPLSVVRRMRPPLPLGSTVVSQAVLGLMAAMDVTVSEVLADTGRLVTAQVWPAFTVRASCGTA